MSEPPSPGAVSNPDPVAAEATIVIFGAMGDLTRRLLVPALANLVTDGLLGEGTTIVGVGFTDDDDETLRKALGSFVKAPDAWERLRQRASYLKGDFTKPETFVALASKVSGPTVFYLAVAPTSFGPIVDRLGEAGLLDQADGFRRIVVEKPFGADLASAKALNAQILARATEDQVFRIDHFLGKETVQNIMVTRFANALVEGGWNNQRIDHVQITAAETVDVGSRGKFYDAAGALRDMMPNHLFQLLALVAMEPPNTFDADAIRAEKAKVISAIRPVTPDNAVRGQYSAGRIGDSAVGSYRDTKDVDPNSRTETYVALKVELDTWRWTGVPFYLRTGKALTARDTEIVVQFRGVPLAMFKGAKPEDLPPNRLTIQLQPNESISMDLVVKKPGAVVKTAAVSMDFHYADRFEVGHRTGYETLLYDVLIGDQTLFQSANQIEAGWRAVAPLLDAWSEGGDPESYVAGTAGPKSAEALIARDSRQWHALG